jgi:hypothetical protein
VIGTLRYIGAISTLRQTSAIGSLQHIGATNRVRQISALGTFRQIGAIGTLRQISAIGTLRQISAIRTLRYVSGIGTLRQISTISTLLHISAICTRDCSRHLYGNLTDTQLYNKLQQFCSHNSLPLVSIISHISPIDTLPHYLFNIQFNILHPFATRLSLHIFGSKFLVPSVRLKFTSYISVPEFVIILFVPYYNSNLDQLVTF